MLQSKLFNRQVLSRDWLTLLFTCALAVTLVLGNLRAVAAQEGEEVGVLIVRVLPNSPAAEVGLQRGDIILSVNGEPTNSAADLVDAIAGHAAGDEIELIYMHGSEEVTATAVLAEVDGRALLGVQPYQENDRGERRMDGRPSNGGSSPDESMPERTMPEAMPALPAVQPGAMVFEVVESSPAAEAGLELGDVIIAVNDDEVSGPEVLVELIGGYAPGETVTLTVLRGDEEINLDVTLAAREDDAERGFMGVQVGAAFPGDVEWQEAPPFDMPFGRGVMPLFTGVLVRDVAEDSPAADAGLEPGDWITEVNGEAVADFEDLRALIDAAQPGDEMALTIQSRGEMPMFGRGEQGRGEQGRGEQGRGEPGNGEATEPESRTVTVILGENEEGKAFLGISVMPMRIEMHEHAPMTPDDSEQEDSSSGEQGTLVPPLFFFRGMEGMPSLPFFFHRGGHSEDGVDLYFHGVPSGEQDGIERIPVLPSQEL